MRVGRKAIGIVAMVVGALNVFGSLLSPSTGTDRDNAVGALFTYGLIIIVGTFFLRAKPKVAQWFYTIAAVLGLITTITGGDYSLLIWPAVYGALAWLTFRSRRAGALSG